MISIKIDGGIEISMILSPYYSFWKISECEEEGNPNECLHWDVAGASEPSGSYAFSSMAEMWIQLLSSVFLGHIPFSAWDLGTNQCVSALMGI